MATQDKCGSQLPISALFVAILVGMSAQDLAFDNGLKPKVRAVYYTTTRGSAFPYNNLTAYINEAGLPIGYDDFVLDTFEAAALVTAVVALVMGIFHRNLDEATLFIWLGGIFYLRHTMAKPQLDTLIGNVKKPSHAAAGEVQVWNAFIFFGLAATLYIQAKAVCKSTAGKAGQKFFKTSVPAFGLAIVAGVIVQGMLFDLVCAKGWVYQSRYYKEFIGGSWPWSDAFEAKTGYPLPLYSWIVVLVTVVIQAALLNLVTRKHFLVQILGLGAIGGVAMKLNEMMIACLKLHEIATEFKGKENKEIRETKNTEALVELKDQNMMLLGMVACAIVLQVLATLFTVPLDEAGKCVAEAWAERVFAGADKNKDGNLTKREIKNYFKEHPDEKTSLLGKDFHWKEFWGEADADGSGDIDRKEFSELAVKVAAKHSL